MYAWRRANAAELNRRARQVWRELGRLGEEELVAPGGIRYAIGDRVVTLAPGANGRVVTSETGTVLNLDAEAKALWVRMDDDGGVRVLQEEEIGSDRLAHGYALTVHRSQGSTVERSHALEDGGGRELAYVKMSRARERSMVYTVADSLEQAVEDLRRDWTMERRPTWVIDARPFPVDARLAGEREKSRIEAERRAASTVRPPDPSAQIRELEQQRRKITERRRDLYARPDLYADHPIRRALAERRRIEATVRRLEHNLSEGRGSRLQRRAWTKEADRWRQRHTEVLHELDGLRDAEEATLDVLDGEIVAKLRPLLAQRLTFEAWIENQVGARQPLRTMDRPRDTNRPLRASAPTPDRVRGAHRDDPTRGRDIGPGLDLGIGW